MAFSEPLPVAGYAAWSQEADSRRLAGLNEGIAGNTLRGLKRNGLVKEAEKDGKAIMYESIDRAGDEE